MFVSLLLSMSFRYVPYIFLFWCKNGVEKKTNNSNLTTTIWELAHSRPVIKALKQSLETLRIVWIVIKFDFIVFNCFHSDCFIYIIIVFSQFLMGRTFCNKINVTKIFIKTSSYSNNSSNNSWHINNKYTGVVFY